jgi:hypothetical protein
VIYSTATYSEDEMSDVVEAVEEFAARLSRYYTTLGGTTSSTMVAYHIEQVKQDIINKYQEVDNVQAKSILPLADTDKRG